MGRRLPVFLSEHEPEQLLRATDRERDRVLLLTILYCGLRVSEATKMEVTDVDFSRGTVLLRRAKGDKDRVVPIPKKLTGPLRGWIGSRIAGPVFPSRQGGHMTTRAVQLLFKRVAKKAGLRNADKPRKVTPHKLRHSYATRLLEAGATILEVSELLGHASIQTTQTYVHTTQTKLKSVVNRI